MEKQREHKIIASWDDEKTTILITQMDTKSMLRLQQFKGKKICLGQLARKVFDFNFKYIWKSIWALKYIFLDFTESEPIRKELRLIYDKKILMNWMSQLSQKLLWSIFIFYYQSLYLYTKTLSQQSQSFHFGISISNIRQFCECFFGNGWANDLKRKFCDRKKQLNRQSEKHCHF